MSGYLMAKYWTEFLERRLCNIPCQVPKRKPSFRIHSPSLVPLIIWLFINGTQVKFNLNTPRSSCNVLFEEGLSM